MGFDSERCLAKKVNGRRCNMDAVLGTFCHWHHDYLFNLKAKKEIVNQEIERIEEASKK